MNSSVIKILNRKASRVPLRIIRWRKKNNILLLVGYNIKLKLHLNSGINRKV
jgi:hypothetical protein